MNRQLSFKTFIISQIIILTLGLIWFGGVYYLLNLPTSKLTGLNSGLPLTSAPTSLGLEVEQPDDNLLLFQPTVLISGKTQPNLNILISNQLDERVIHSKVDGRFSTFIELDEGVNNIDVYVFDNFGNSKTVNRTIYYSKEKI